MDEMLLQIAQKQLETANRVLVVSHIRPDGDAIGSLLGLGLTLQASGKYVQMVLADGVPLNFRHLQGSEEIRNKPDGEFDLIAVVDCSDLDRVGGSLDGYPEPDINIDHHPTNLNFARLNLVDQSAVATAEILAEILPKFGFPINPGGAAALLNGIVTDTLGFRTYNTSPKSLRIAADLMELGGNLPELYHRSLLGHSYEAVKYWGSGIARLQREGKILWTALTREDRLEAGYRGRDDADLINVLTSIDHADVVLVFIEQNDGKVKVSWRSQPGIDVSQIALRFGGGGHAAASGAMLEGSLQDVKSQVLNATRALFDGN